MHEFGADALAASLAVVMLLPMITALIAGAISGAKMSGLNWVGGMVIGLVYAVGTAIGQLMVMTKARFDLHIIINPAAFMDAMQVSAAITTALCFLWSFLVGRRSYWRNRYYA